MSRVLPPSDSVRLVLVLVVIGLHIAIGDAVVRAQDPVPAELGRRDPFRQLEEILPTPNAERSASGAPGPGYWQQRADYVIAVEIDDEARRLRGSETITYHNHSPDTLRYLWVQLDQNRFLRDSDSALTTTTNGFDRLSYRGLRRLLETRNGEGGYRVHSVRDARGDDLAHTIVRTMMRIDLPTPLATGESVSFSIDWEYAILDADLHRVRSGYELFEEDGNCIYEIAQWFPRMAPYTDVHGWHHQQFLGDGEFSLEFGDYLVRITAPADHVVAATGVLQNPDTVLSVEQRERLERAATAEAPVFVVTPEEAKEAEKSRAAAKKTWIFHAEDVRDFAFATSRKFIWDAWGHEVEGHHVLAMSFYPNEGEPLWSKYSTHAIVHTLDVYSRFAFAYPYPVAISVNGPVGGMEYPMICFNGPRPEKDGTYSKRTKYGLISVIIHEVGHNWFPMIVNSDERRWTWMDEGINTFVQYLAEQEWEDGYPSWWGQPQSIVGYMRSTEQVPIMTNADSVLRGGPNAYGKPSVALTILRETVLGRELFDHAFREYALRWRFKRPMPADLFRTLEDASGVDLDWFWRGWFYTTDHCDLAIEGVRELVLETGDPDVDKPRLREERDARPQDLTRRRNAELRKRVEEFAELEDFYNRYDELDVTEREREDWKKTLESLSEDEKALIASGHRFWVIDLRNVGGLVMPVILAIEYEDGESEELRIPAEIWRKNSREVSKLIVSEKGIRSITLDPHLETADADMGNNHFPPRPVPSRFRLFKEGRGGGSNPMREAKRAEKPEDPAPDATTTRESRF